MSSDKDLSNLKDAFLQLREHDSICDVVRDRMNFFVWELKMVDSFLGLQSCPFAGECGIMLNVTQKMLNIWKTLYATSESPNAESYFEEFILTSQRDEFLDSNKDPFTFHVPTEIWQTKLEFRAKYSFPKITLSVNKVDDIIPNPDFVMEFIDSVEENLNVLLQIDDPCSLLFVPGSKDQIEKVLKELKLLRFFILFLSHKCIEPQSHATLVAWLYLPNHGNKNQDLAPSEMNVLFSDLLKMKTNAILPGIHKVYVNILQALKPTIQPEWHPTNQNEHAAGSVFSVETVAHSLVELPTVSNPCQVIGLNDQMEILREMLNLLRDNLINLPVLDLEHHCQDMSTVIVDAGLLIYSLYDIKGEKENTVLEDVNRELGLDLPRNIEPVKAMIYLIIRKAFQSNLSRIHGLGYVDFLLNNLKEFQSRNSDTLFSVMSQLQIIQTEIENLQPFLKDVAEERYNKHAGPQLWATQFIGKAYELEYVTDAFIRKEVPHWCLERWLLDIIEEITLIRAEVAAIPEKQVAEVDLVSHDTLDTSTVHTPSQLATNRSMNEEIVGFDDVREELKNKLTKGCRELDVISILGMPGLGKTTLAYKLYSDNSVISRFDIRAQCCVSRVYRRMDLLMALLHDATGMRDSVSCEADAAEKLRRTLMGKRYLILVDDVWEASAWDDLSSCFYDAKNGSRIILTTRHREVANYATSFSKPIPLRIFNDEESWKLLEDKVFGKESCSSALEKVGQQIARKCGGLPLSIVLVAGILAKMEKNKENWKQVATTLGSHIHSDSKAIVEQSYQDLPYHLKACFLYFGAFLEDTVIDASWLTRSWISEAFIKSCEGKSLEDIAEGYLEHLIGRNLVMVSKRTYLDGKVKACRIHDVLLEFCKNRATEENFLLWRKWDQNVNPSSRIYSSRKQHAQPRLAFCEVDNLAEWSSSCSLVGSILSRRDNTSICKLAISGILQNFKFLKVLDLEQYVVIDSFPANLVHLRYFSAKTNQMSIPSSISNLRNLETLIIKGRRGSMSGPITVPITVWKMVKLKHVHISGSDGNGFVIEDAEELLEDSTKLHDLATLSTPYLSCVEDAELMLRKAPNLRELKCKFRGDSSGPFPDLDFPTRLETLHIIAVFWYQMFPVCISGSNLKDLTMFKFRLGNENLSSIAQLQNLQALQLTSIQFDDEKWEVSSDEFIQLKVLKLIDCNSLKEWTVSDDAFPNLERLVLRRCWNIKETPSCFGDILSLKSIEVKYCNESVVKSARVIRETQVEEYQNADFKLIIK
uniref:LOW QUALITY PROTEIN: late blight resistance protein R1-A-like n=1 Tax=Nicotiana sylvestris TaxID=4096 RepID=A0A1U7Y4K1_NICSY|nr:PREDICTED: LOW QUALITY PROTEIN: late blight resistance protein R1-A-like [Nicotiana sylvestris]